MLINSLRICRNNPIWEEHPDLFAFVRNQDFQPVAAKHTIAVEIISECQYSLQEFFVSPKRGNQQGRQLVSPPQGKSEEEAEHERLRAEAGTRLVSIRLETGHGMCSAEDLAED
jgi:hypothetical protein